MGVEGVLEGLGSGLGHVSWEEGNSTEVCFCAGRCVKSLYITSANI